MWEGDTREVDSPPWMALQALAGLDDATLRATCRRRRYARGEVIFHEGDPAGAFHLLDKGRVAVRLTTPRGDVATIDVLQPGDTFGEQAFVDGSGERSATITALEKVETLTIDAATFESMRDTYPRLDRFLLSVVSARLRSTSHQLLDALYMPADERVLRCIVRLAAMFANGSKAWIPLTQNDIATMTGVTRSTVNRLLRQAQAEGLVAVSRSSIEVVDEAALRRKAGLRPAAVRT